MEKFKISLPTGEPFITATLTFNDEEYEISLDWSFNGGYYRVSMFRGGEPLPILGKGLNPDVDLFKDLDSGIGKLYLEGAQPTLDNLNLDNKLIYEPVQQTVSNQV